MFQKYSKLLISTIEVRDGMDEVENTIPPGQCDCENSNNFKLEL